jgi:type I restriction enzyme S subunit
MSVNEESMFDKTEWEEVKLGSLATEINKRVSNPAESTFDKFVGLEHFDSGQLFIERYASTQGLTSSGKKFETGDVLFARRNAYLRRASMTRFSGVCSGDAFVLRENKLKLVNGFLSLIVNSSSLWDFANANAAGTMSKRVKWRDLEQFKIKLPNIQEQAKILDMVLNLDKTINQTEETEQLLVKLQKAIWNKAKEGADLIRVKEVAKVSNGTTPSTSDKTYWDQGNVPWLPTGCVHQKFIKHSDKFVTQKAIQDKKSKLFPVGSTLVAMIGQGKTRGKSAKLLINAAINQNFACVTPKSINSDILFYSLYFNYQRLRDISQGTNQLALNCELIGNFKIPVLDKSTQDIVANKLASIENALEELNEKLTSSRKLLTEILEKVF